MIGHGFEPVDVAAVVLFFAAWSAYTWVVNSSRWRTKTITHRMVAFRHQWMLNMVARDARMFDALIHNSLQQGVVFFASTSILLIGGLLAGLGSAEKAMRVLSDFGVSSTNTRTEWEVKILLIVVIFMYAFFKFAWAYRLFTYVFIMFGAAPQSSDDEQAAARYAAKVAEMHAIGARHFTTGLSSYFYALCAVAWFINAWAFMVATVWVSLVLVRRAFRSKFMKVLSV